MRTKKLTLTIICGAVLASAALVTCGCSAGMKGTYSDAGGAMVLDLKSGGKATFTFQGDAADCTYDTNDKKLTVDCKGPAGKAIFNVHEDGSLTGPPGSFIPVLRKSK
jgi:hypothetical protein